MATFDSNSAFWVCDNSATGHICNQANMFHGPLKPSNCGVQSATGTSDPLQMGTVVLSVIDDEGMEHTFILSRVLHMSKSPVNILSTRKLAEHYPDKFGRPDKEGTGVLSLFAQHTCICM